MTGARHRILRDWLRGHPAERDRYAAAKRQAASELSWMTGRKWSSPGPGMNRW
jgi:GrpB-like predicted nucleotidyltransferase (UPF0157 family)